MRSCSLGYPHVPFVCLSLCLLSFCIPVFAQEIGSVNTVRPTSEKPSSGKEGVPQQVIDDGSFKANPKKPPLRVDGLGGDTDGIIGSQGNGERLFGTWARGLNLSGGWNLLARANDVSGSSQAKDWFNFQNNNQYLNNSSLGPFQQNLNVGISGKLFNTVDVNANLSNNRVRSSLSQLMRMHFDSKSGTVVDVGDVSASMSGNELIPFSRNVQGIKYQRNLGSGSRLSTIASVTRALTRRNVFVGQGITGPYYLGGSQIVPGTERLTLNGEQLDSGVDYEIDYQLGIVRFLKGRIINRSDTVEYTYELLNYNSGKGVLTGFRWDLPLQGGRAVGMTMLRQTASTSGSNSGIVTEYFPVSSVVSTRYSLVSPIDVTVPVEVRYQERLLVEGIAADYFINRELNYIQLRRPLPPDTSLTGISSLRVKYKPVRQEGIGGDRQVVGLDTQFPAGMNGLIKVQVGQSQGISAASSGSGVDIQTRFSSPDKQRKNRWSVITGLRNVGTGFSSVDSTAGAFLRTGRELKTQLRFTPAEGTDFSGNILTSQFPNMYGSSLSGTVTTTPTSLSNSTGFGFTVSHRLKARKGTQAPTLRVSHNQTGQRLTYAAPPSGDSGSGTSTSQPPRSSYASDSIGLDWGFQNVQFGVTLDQTLSRGRSVFANAYSQTVGTGGSNTGGGFLGNVNNGNSNASVTNGASTNLRFNTTYTPSSRLSLSSNIGTSRNLSSGTSSSATDNQVSVLYWLYPDKLQFDVQLSDSKNGQNLDGFYGSGGIIGGGTAGLTSTGQQTRTRDLRFTYTPTSILRAEIRTSTSLMLVPNYDNTDMSSNDFSLTYAPSTTFNVNATISQQLGNYVGGQGDFDNTNWSLTASHGAADGIQIRTGYMRMNYGSSTALGGGGGGGLGGGGGFGGGGFGGGGFSLQQGTNDVISLRVDVPLKRLSPFIEMNDLNASNPLSSPGGNGGGGSYYASSNYHRFETRFGVDFRLTQLLGATLDVRFARLKDRENSAYSYSAKSFNFDISARF